MLLARCLSLEKWNLILFFQLFDFFVCLFVVFCLRSLIACFFHQEIELNLKLGSYLNYLLAQMCISIYELIYSEVSCFCLGNNQFYIEYFIGEYCKNTDYSFWSNVWRTSEILNLQTLLLSACFSFASRLLFSCPATNLSNLQSKSLLTCLSLFDLSDKFCQELGVGMDAFL